MLVRRRSPFGPSVGRMTPRIRTAGALAGASALALTLAAPATAHDHRPKGKHPHHGQEVRFATFNASLNRATEGQLEQDLSTGDNEQARNVAETIQRADPDVVLVGERDKPS